MGGDTGEIQLGSKRELYKYNINHYAVVIVKASSKIILVQVYIWCWILVIGRYAIMFRFGTRLLPLRPFLTRKFFQEILGLEGSKKNWEKKIVSYEEIFRQNFLAQNFLSKVWLEFS